MARRKIIEKWFFEKLKTEEDYQKFADWLNIWGDVDRHDKSKSESNRMTEYAQGYHQAIRDIFDRLGLSFGETQKFKKLPTK